MAKKVKQYTEEDVWLLRGVLNRLSPSWTSMGEIFNRIEKLESQVTALKKTVAKLA